jgi:hypothetical protein
MRATTICYNEQGDKIATRGGLVVHSNCAYRGQA